MTLEPNTLISHYKILSEIGKGGMGIVYLAQDTKLERKVAIKFLPKESNRDKEKLGRFVQEAKAASALNHPGILTVYEIGEAEGSTYIASEYINGTDIGSFIRERKISLEKALDIAIQLVTALKAAHDSGIVHRDIKPDNVMIREDGIIKVLDFGLAKLLERSKDGRPLNTGPDSETMIADAGGPKTSPGMVMGTVNYMSPEQSRGREVDQRTDIFSVGALLYEVLTRKRAFDGDSTSDVIAAVLMKDPVPVSELNPGIPQQLQEIVGRCLRKEKEERFESARELLDELTRLKRHLEIEEIERTILPEEERRETKMFPATTAGASGQTTDGDNDSIVIRRSMLGRLAIAGAALILAGIAAFFAWSYFFPGEEQIESIAVMPFVNESGAAELEYLSDGMTETLINDLSEIPDLKVKARSSVFRYKGKNASPSTIAEELGVQAVLFGRVVQRGNRVSLSLELINARTENILWGNKYENDVSELAGLQSKIARDVAEKLVNKLSGEASETVASRNTDSSEAYQAYLKGRFHWNKRTEEGFRKAIEFFEEAIELDPEYALAWSGLADSNLLLPEYGNYRPDEYIPKAKAAAEKALKFDPDLAEAHTSLAYVKASYEWDFKEAEGLYKRAIELDPEYATAYQWYAELQMDLKKWDEAEAYARKAVELDPLAPIKSYVLGGILFRKGDLTAAEAQLKRALEIQSNFGPSFEYLAQIYAIRNRKDEALRVCDQPSMKADEAFDYCEGIVYALAGEKEKATAFLSAYKFSGARKAFNVALINAEIGRKDRAFELLEQVLEARHSYILALNSEPASVELRADPRYKELMRKVGLPE